jgi:hypothetical protein
MLIKTSSEKGHFIHSFYKKSKNEDKPIIDNLRRRNEYNIVYKKCTTADDMNMHNTISNLKNFELASLTKPNIEEMKKSLINDGYVLIPVTKKEQTRFYNLSKQIFENLHPGVLQTKPDENKLPQFRIVDIDDSFKVAQQVNNLVENLVGYKIPLNANSHFQLNTIASTMHVDSKYNFIFSFTTSPKSAKMPRTQYLPIKHNSEFEPSFMRHPHTNEMVHYGYDLKEDSELDISSNLEEVPENNAILFLGDNKFSNPDVQKNLEDKFLHHQAPSGDSPRINMTIRMREQI